MKFYLLGTKVNTAHRNWEELVMDKLDDAKSRDAVNDLSIIGYALLQALSTTTHQAKLDDEKENRY